MEKCRLCREREGTNQMYAAINGYKVKHGKYCDECYWIWQTYAQLAVRGI